jgi:hypothetical protein
MTRHRFAISASLFLVLCSFSYILQAPTAPDAAQTKPLSGFDSVILNKRAPKDREGRRIFRFDTVGDEAFQFLIGA